MPCRTYRSEDGKGAAILCGRGPLPKMCVVCFQRYSSKLCDFPLTGSKKGKTCDRPLCQSCAVHKEPNTDYCPTHARMMGIEAK
jgi:hypothetical protein